MKKIPLSKVYLTDEIREAILRAVDSGQYILTQECEALEAELAAHTLSLIHISEPTRH